MTRTFEVKGKEFTSDLCDQEALDILATIDSDFARSILGSYKQWGLSTNQLAWVHKLAMDKKTKPKPVASVDLVRVVELLTTAKGNLKYPKVTVHASEDLSYKLQLAGDKARFPGSINITDGRPFGEAKWYGRIHTDGRLDPSKDMTAEIRSSLGDLEDNPVGFATSYGRMTGNCCFCNKQLTDASSVEHGYGKTCAKNWGLPYTTAKKNKASQAPVA